MGLKLWQVDPACSFRNGWAPDSSIDCFRLWWHVRVQAKRLRRRDTARAVAKRFGVNESTIGAWREQGAPRSSDEELQAWLVRTCKHVPLRRKLLRPRILELYERNFGAKAIAKMLGISPRIARTILIETGMYQPGKLKRLGGISITEGGGLAARLSNSGATLSGSLR
jgi:hypothetical protein